MNCSNFNAMVVFTTLAFAILPQKVAFSQPDTTQTVSIRNGSDNLRLIRAMDSGFAIGTDGWAGVEGRRDPDFQIIKLDSDLEITWRGFYPGIPDSDHIADQGMGIALFPDSGFVMVGVRSGGGLMIRTDAQGELIWRRYWQRQDISRNACAVCSDGNVIAAGSNALGKFSDANEGNTIWTRSYDNPWGIGSIISLDDGSFAISANTTRLGAQRQDMYAAKIDSEGEIVWENAYGTENTEFCWSIIKTSDGGFCLVGLTRLNNDAHDEFGMIIRLDSEGNELWQRVDDEAQPGVTLRHIVETPDGGFAATGYDGTHRFYILRVDCFGEVFWRKQIRKRLEDGLNVTGESNSILLMEDGGYLLGGFSTQVGCWLVRTEPDPVVIPFELSSAPSHDFGEVFVDSVANYELVVTNTGRRYADIVRAEISLGSEVFAVEFGELPRLFPGDSATLSLVFQPDSAIAYEGVLSVFFGADIVTDTLEIALTGRGIPNVGVSDSAVNPTRSVVLLGVSPNPFNGQINLGFALPTEGLVKIGVYDVSGRLLEVITNSSFQAGTHSVLWNAENCASGLYVVRIEANHAIGSRKIQLLK